MKAVGLWKKCPRCGRMGEVFIDGEMSEPRLPMFAVAPVGQVSDQHASLSRDAATEPLRCHGIGRWRRWAMSMCG